jgi:hypothetical protein
MFFYGETDAGPFMKYGKCRQDQLEECIDRTELRVDQYIAVGMSLQGKENKLPLNCIDRTIPVSE